MVGKTLFAQRDMVDLMLEIVANTSNTLFFFFKKMKDLRRVRAADPSATQPTQSPQQGTTAAAAHASHRGHGGMRTVGITSHGVMINDSHRPALIGKSTNYQVTTFCQ